MREQMSLSLDTNAPTPEPPPAFAGRLIADPSAPVAVLPVVPAAPARAVATQSFPSLATDEPLSYKREGDRRWVVCAKNGRQVGAVWDTGGGYVAWYVRNGGGFADGVKQAVDKITAATRRTL